MKIKSLYNTIKSIVLDTRGFWDSLQVQTAARKHLFKGVAYPLIVLTGAASLLGNLLAIASTEYTLLYIIASVLFLMLSLLVSMFVIFIIIKELSIKYEGSSNMLEVEKLCIYSLSVYWAALIVSGLLVNHGPLRNFIEVIGVIFGAFVFYRGVEPVLSVKKDDKLLFSFISLLIAIAVHFIVFWSLGFVTAVIKNFSL